MANLYELIEEFKDAERLLNEAETQEEYDEALEMVIESESNLTVKVDNIARYIKNLDGEIGKWKTEEKRLTDKRRSLENKQANLKKFLKDMLEVNDMESIQGELFKVKIQDNSQYTIDIADESAIPQEYFEQVPKLDKKLLKEDILENGLVIDGVHVYRGQHVRIR